MRKNIIKVVRMESEKHSQNRSENGQMTIYYVISLFLRLSIFFQLQMNKSDPMGLLLNPGQTYNPLEGQAEDPCPSARLHSPMDRNDQSILTIFL